MRKPHPAFGALFLWSVISAAETQSSESANNPTLAEQLFREGRTLMQQGRKLEACPKFAESHRLDPALGTRINLGVCYEEVGRTASAWFAYRGALLEANQQGHAERAAAVQQRLEKLETRLSRLRIDVAQIGKNASVLVDGALIERSTISAGLPVDPGVHVIAIQDANQQVFRLELPVSDADRLIFVPIQTKHLASAQTEPLRTRQPANAPAATTPASPWPRRTIALSLAGSGLAVALAGGIFAWKAHQSYEDASARCPKPEECTSPTALSMRQRADTFDIAATTALASASLLLVGGGVLYFWAPTERRPGVALAPIPGGASAGLEGQF